MFLNGKALDYFLSSKNASFYAVPRYRTAYANRFLSTYAPTIAIWNEVVQFKDVKQQQCETEVESNARVNKIAY